MFDGTPFTWFARESKQGRLCAITDDGRREGCCWCLEQIKMKVDRMRDKCTCERTNPCMACSSPCSFAWTCIPPKEKPCSGLAPCIDPSMSLSYVSSLLGIVRRNSKGGIPKNKMEVFNGIFHEGGVGILAFHLSFSIFSA